MNHNYHEVESRVLLMREPSQLTGSEKLQFSDECWAEEVRLSSIPSVHYQMVMAIIQRAQNRLSRLRDSEPFSQ
ncbi:hypothetical protein ACN5LO_004018 [Cronobacter sakazakii]|uniref:hypothetical protein n=1 Tax=Cronobacter dublinensis TaxID=413497 RepID=UPI0024AD3C6F|nr:hypothetical protein [Cronobacter dublinensis]MDI6447170.1 hypothetical protein [Cronobacter dublinensis]